METRWRKHRGRGHCCSETAGPCGNWGCKGIGASIIKDAEKEGSGLGVGLVSDYTWCIWLSKHGGLLFSLTTEDYHRSTSLVEQLQSSQRWCERRWSSG